MAGFLVFKPSFVLLKRANMMCDCENESLLNISDVQRASVSLQAYLEPTPLEFNTRLSSLTGAEVFIKREDKSPVRSFKIRGALNFLLSLTPKQRKAGVICASAGNHAQGVAFACQLLGINGLICMPTNTPKQKVNQVEYLGALSVEAKLVGDNFEQCCSFAKQKSEQLGRVFIHPFDDFKVMAGQGTVALEMMSELKKPADIVLFPIGGGGLASGVSTVFRELSPCTELIGVEVEGSSAMAQSIFEERRVVLDDCDFFADGTAVAEVGVKTFDICRKNLDDVKVVSKSELSRSILDLYNNYGIIVEPSGALPFAALAKFKKQFKGKRVIIILSGANNDVSRIPEILTLAD